MENALQWKPENINVCVCSFSEDRDSLSQWRAYGARTSGFAIGFPADLLTSATDRKGWYLAPCVYKPAKQREIIRLLVEKVLEEHLSRDYGFSATEKDEEGISLRGSGGSLLAYLNRYAPILKDESFSEEKEWRVISRPLINQSADFSFREGQSLLIPYSKFPLSYDDMPFRLKEVVIGPTPDPERSRSSITNFLVHRGVLEGLRSRGINLKRSLSGLVTGRWLTLKSESSFGRVGLRIRPARRTSALRFCGYGFVSLDRPVSPCSRTVRQLAPNKRLTVYT